MFWRRKKKQPEKTEETAQIEGRKVRYSLVRSSRRTLGLQIREGGELVVRAPYHISRRRIEDWIYKKSRWIEKHQARFRKKKKPPLQYREGEWHLYLGEEYVLKTESAGKARVRLEPPFLRVGSRAPDDPETIEAALKNWYRREARRLFSRRIDSLFPPFGARGYEKPALKIRWMKRQWGNLHSKGVMTLNAKLMRAPQHLIDYVVVHELCHLEEMNHGPGFYALMDDMMPGWKDRKKALEDLL